VGECEAGDVKESEGDRCGGLVARWCCSSWCTFCCAKMTDSMTEAGGTLGEAGGGAAEPFWSTITPPFSISYNKINIKVHPTSNFRPRIYGTINRVFSQHSQSFACHFFLLGLAKFNLFSKIPLSKTDHCPTNTRV
jgi:hypothetical protein